MNNEENNVKENEQAEEVTEETEVFEAELVDDEVKSDKPQDSATDENDAEETEKNSEVEELKSNLNEMNNRMLRLQADYDNFRRRTKSEKEADAKYRSKALAEKVLPVLDNFERGLKVEATSDDALNLIKGLEIVYSQLKKALEEEGIVAIETVGEVFDPHYHQAVMKVESDEHETNTVIEELQKGYMIKDRVIRPAMVKVNA